MRIPFFGRREKRQDGSFTEAAIDRLIQSFGGEPAKRVSETAAAAIASGTVARAFSVGEVEPGAPRTGLTPSVLSEIGASLVLSGESVWLIDVEAGGVRLHRAASWSIDGRGADGWRYLLTLNGPSDSVQRSVPAEAVIHPRINCAASEPHRGRSPLALTGLSGQTLANAEEQLRDETSGPVGRLIPSPEVAGATDTEADPLADLVATLAGLKGRAALVPTMNREWGAGSGQAFADWQSRRLGAEPPAALVELLGQRHDAILAAAGVPPMMFATGGQAQATREALRQFLHLTIAPLARQVEAEASLKLAAPVSIDFQALAASDVQGRARAFNSLVGGGMSLADAAAASGILQGDG